MLKNKKILLSISLAVLLFLGVILWFYYDSKEISIPGSFTGRYVNVDGCFVYHLSTTLINSDKKPLANTKVIGFSKGNSEPDSIDPAWQGFSNTDSSGKAELMIFSGMTWGGGYDPDREDPPRPPVPNNPKRLYLWHKDKEDRWHQTEVKVEDKNIQEAKPGTLYIHIDNVQIDENPEEIE